VYFVTQNPLDVPEAVLAQLGNRVQHALRAYTPREAKAVKAAAGTFRPNPAFSAFEAITQLGVGEALVSTLQEKGEPSVVERTLIRPPCSRIGPATPEERRLVIERSPLAGRYDQTVDRESAYEILKAKAEQELARAGEAQPAEPRTSATSVRVGSTRASERVSLPNRGRGGRSRQTVVEAMATSVARSLGTQIGRQIMRGLLGSILKH
jgi:DNA helicase HerA-like ATPase